MSCQLQCFHFAETSPCTTQVACPVQDARTYPVKVQEQVLAFDRDVVAANPLPAQRTFETARCPEHDASNIQWLLGVWPPFCCSKFGWPVDESMPVNDPQISTDVSGIFTASFRVTGGSVVPKPLGVTWKSQSPHAHLELTQLPGLSRDLKTMTSSCQFNSAVQLPI